MHTGRVAPRNLSLFEFYAMTSTRSHFFVILAFLCSTVPLLAQEAVVKDAITATTTPAHRMDENNKKRVPIALLQAGW